MKFGLSMFGLGPRHYARVAQAAEAAGFDSVWLPDHVVFPETIPATYPYDASGVPGMDSSVGVFDPWVILAAVAQATTTILMGTAVYILPLRHPIIAGRALVTLDHLSNGRVLLGAGVGWLEPEFEIMGEDFTKRGKRMDETIPLLRRMWTEPTIEHHGEFFDMPPFKFNPKPRKGTIPILIGGDSPAALRRAGRLGDGWLEIGLQSLEELSGRLAKVRAARSEAGLPEAPFDVTLIMRPKDMALTDEVVRRLEDLGVGRIIVGQVAKATGGITVDTACEWAAEFGRETISRYA